MSLIERLFWIIFSTFSSLFCCVCILAILPQPVKRWLDSHPTLFISLVVFIDLFLFFLFYFTVVTY